MNIGQKVWYVPQDKYSYRGTVDGLELLITKIGRKWITLEHKDRAWLQIRVEMEQPNASQEGYRAHDKRGDFVGNVYVDRQHEIYVKERRGAWERIQRCVSRYFLLAPQSLTLVDIKKIADLLEVELEPAVDPT